jgi:hypothetical protein
MFAPKFVSILQLPVQHHQNEVPVLLFERAQDLYLQEANAYLRDQGLQSSNVYSTRSIVRNWMQDLNRSDGIVLRPARDCDHCCNINEVDCLQWLQSCNEAYGSVASVPLIAQGFADTQQYQFSPSEDLRHWGFVYRAKPFFVAVLYNATIFGEDMVHFTQNHILVRSHSLIPPSQGLFLSLVQLEHRDQNKNLLPFEKAFSALQRWGGKDDNFREAFLRAGRMQSLHHPIPPSSSPPPSTIIHFTRASRRQLLSLVDRRY